MSVEVPESSGSNARGTNAGRISPSTERRGDKYVEMPFDPESETVAANAQLCGIELIRFTVKLLLNAGSRINAGSLINAGVLRPVF